MFSDFEDNPEDKILRIAARKHSLLGIRVYDEKDNEIPDIGYALFRDSETGQQVWANTSNARWRYNFAEKQNMKTRQITDLFEKSSAGFLNIGTGQDYAKFLFQYFQRK